MNNKPCDVCNEPATHYVMYDGVEDPEYTAESGYTYQGSAGDVCREHLEEILSMRKDFRHFAARYVEQGKIVFRQRGAWISLYPDWSAGVSIGDWNWIAEVRRKDELALLKAMFEDMVADRVQYASSATVKMRRENQKASSLIIRMNGDRYSIGAVLGNGHAYDVLYNIVPEELDQLFIRYIEARGERFPMRLVEKIAIPQNGGEQ